MEWVAISFSNAWPWKVKVKLLSRVRLLATPWTAAYQAPPSVGFFQTRVLEWVAIAFSDFFTWALLIPVQTLQASWTREGQGRAGKVVAEQGEWVIVAQSHLTLCNPMDYSLPGSSSMEFSRQEYWSGLPFPSPRWSWERKENKVSNDTMTSVT